MIALREQLLQQVGQMRTISELQADCVGQRDVGMQEQGHDTLHSGFCLQDEHKKW